MECVEAAGCSSGNGYAYVHQNGQRLYAHRHAWQQRNGPIPDGMYVLHSCDNRRCVNPDHLRVGTHDDNMRDMSERQRNRVPHPNMKGEKHHQAKMAEPDVRNIRRLHANGLSHQTIADLYGVARSTISFITRRETWTHV